MLLNQLLLLLQLQLIWARKAIVGAKLSSATWREEVGEWEEEEEVEATEVRTHTRTPTLPRTPTCTRTLTRTAIDYRSIITPTKHMHTLTPLLAPIDMVARRIIATATAATSPETASATHHYNHHHHQHQQKQQQQQCVCRDLLLLLAKGVLVEVRP